MSKATFPKSQRLYLNSHKERVFSSRTGFVAYPFKVVYACGKEIDMLAPVELLVSVPKKRLKHAVDRNLVKRRTKEAYRLHKNELLAQAEKSFGLLVAFLYIGDGISSYSAIEQGVKKALRKLTEVCRSLERKEETE
ncbi:ribonuclease P protein component [Porphyromonas sp. COT-108 OH2963]|uniref:ribonuclease P protein component n=1 Tax=Porphyromonas sp. COT-108 OH2963 TaxID=1515614 RepID=UPI0006894BA9|nr:ribonuclease P protein component [Porphyromonas sp. COT-108 OH2963]